MVSAVAIVLNVFIAFLLFAVLLYIMIKGTRGRSRGAYARPLADNYVGLLTENDIVEGHTALPLQVNAQTE